MVVHWQLVCRVGVFLDLQCLLDIRKAGRKYVCLSPFPIPSPKMEAVSTDFLSSQRVPLPDTRMLTSFNNNAASFASLTALLSSIHGLPNIMS